jgi:hypothetical protein
MKILIEIEDSIFSYNAARFVARRPWHSGTQARPISDARLSGAPAFRFHRELNQVFRRRHFARRLVRVVG